MGISAEQAREVIAYARPAAGAKTLVSITNFGAHELALPEGEVLVSSEPLTGALGQDASVWMLLG